MDANSGASSHALLLRFFQSPFFTWRRAVEYLASYNSHIGISWYLTNRLRALAPQELAEAWGVICHLLVTRPSKSAAVECFVIERCESSTHIALMTLWYMQAYLRDPHVVKGPSPSLSTCQRVLHKLHGIIFEEQSDPTPYSSHGVDVLAHAKVRASAASAFVGMGMVLLGAPGLPSLANHTGRIAVEQGRHESDISAPRIVHVDVEDDMDESDHKPSNQQPEPTGDERDNENLGYFPRARTLKLSDVLSPTQDIHSQRPDHHRRITGAAQTSPSLALRALTRHTVDDPLGQTDPPSPAAAAPSISTPSFHSSSAMPGQQGLPEHLLRSMLRAHFCRSEVHFVTTLETIANRLLVVPKPARVSALRAELTALNHKLPAEICIPLWCTSSDNVSPSMVSVPHHRVVRIPPSESVVLNSAERAPYVLLIEVLHDDLNFDPATRENKETLKKIMVKDSRENSGSITSWTADALVQAAARTALAAETLPSEVAEKSDGPVPPQQSSSPVQEEEVDLVEQVYGTSLSEPVVLDSLVLPVAPRHKDLDAAAWTRSRSPVPTSSGAVVQQNGHSHSQSYGSPVGTPKSATFRQHGRVFSSPELGGQIGENASLSQSRPILSLDDYAERMRTAAVMLAQLNSNQVRDAVTTITPPGGGAVNVEPVNAGALSWLPGTGWISRSSTIADGPAQGSETTSNAQAATMRMKLQPAEAAAIRDRIMKEMMALEEERMERMKEGETYIARGVGESFVGTKSAEDEGIIRRELNKIDPSATVFREPWAAKKARIRAGSPYGHLANWDVFSVIVKTGTDLRQEQLALHLIHEFEQIFRDEKCQCWLRPFKILIIGGTSGLVETITDAVSLHSIKKAEYARRLAEGRLGYVTLLDHFKSTYGEPAASRFVRAQRNFARSLAGYSLVTYFLQIKDRHNGNILIDSEGHCVHIDFGFMLSNTPGNVGFEAAPFKLTAEYLELLGGVDGAPFREFKKLFHEGFEAARKHSDRIVSMVELMQKDSALPCFLAYGDQTAQLLRDRFQPNLKNVTMSEHIERLILTSMGSAWTRLYDAYQYYSQSIL